MSVTNFFWLVILCENVGVFRCSLKWHKTQHEAAYTNAPRIVFSNEVRVEFYLHICTSSTILQYQKHFSSYSLAFWYKRRCRNRNLENDPPTKKRKYPTISFFYLPIFFSFFSSSVPYLLVSANKIKVFLFWNRPRYWSGTGIGSWISAQQNRSNPT